MEQEEKRSEQEVRESIAYHKRVIRHLEVMFIILAVVGVALFGIIAYRNGLLNVLSLTLTIIALFRIWKIGEDWEISKFWDELELTQHTHENTYNEDDKIF
jgi:hypothetical protein